MAWPDYVIRNRLLVNQEYVTRMRNRIEDIIQFAAINELVLEVGLE